MSLLQYAEYKDMICVVTDSDLLGHFCGYVGVMKDHPWYEKHYDEVNSHINVHGGLTFSSNVIPGLNIENKGYWYFGFDCAHAGDICSYENNGQDIDTFGGNIHIWTINAVMAECMYLADQVQEVYKDKIPSALAMYNLLEHMENQLAQMGEAADNYAETCKNSAEKLAWTKISFYFSKMIDISFDALSELKELYQFKVYPKVGKKQTVARRSIFMRQPVQTFVGRDRCIISQGSRTSLLRQLLQEKSVKSLSKLDSRIKKVRGIFQKSQGNPLKKLGEQIKKVRDLKDKDKDI